MEKVCTGNKWVNSPKLKVTLTVTFLPEKNMVSKELGLLPDAYTGFLQLSKVEFFAIIVKG